MTALEQIRLRQIGFKVIDLQIEIGKLKLRVLKLKRQTTINSYNQTILCKEIEMRRIRESEEFKLWWYRK